MKHLLLLFLSFSITHTLLAQQPGGRIQAVVQDSATTLSNATVSLRRAADSSITAFTATNASGQFEFTHLDTGTYVISISYQSFQTVHKTVVITRAQPVVSLGTLTLQHLYKTLEEVIMKDGPAVRVSGNTISFNAASFRTLPNAVAEDLLKKLPGLQVARDGTITAQGETVQKLYVDGKEFFSNDPRLATRNITADMIQEVQVYDERSEQSRFSKIDDGTRTKTINLVLKADKKRGNFGQVGAGYGTQDRFSADARLNRFNGDRRLSVFAASNNNNQVGLSPGRMQPAASGGVTTNTNAGINYNDTWSPAWEGSGNYNVNHSDSRNNRSSRRQNFFPSGIINDERRSQSQYNNNSQRAGLRLTYTINERNSITYVPNVSLQNSTSENVEASVSTKTYGAQAVRINESNTQLHTANENRNWANNLIWQRRFQKTGRTLSATFSTTHARNNQQSRTQALLNDFDSTGTNVRDSLLNQQSHRNTTSQQLAAALSYTEPLSNHAVWELNYNYTRSQNTSDRHTFNYDAITHDYLIENAALTNIFESQTSSSRAGTNLRISKGKLNYQAGMAYARSLLISNDLSKQISLKQRFGNLFPVAQLGYQLSRYKSLRLQYCGATSQPSVLQLQSIPDVSNPRYIREGNPALRQEFNHNFSATYNSYNSTSLRSFFAAATFNNTQHSIAYSTQRIDSFGSQRIRPVNLDGSMTATGNIDFGLPINRGKVGTINTNTTVSYNREPVMVDGVRSFSTNLALGQELRLNVTLHESFDINLTANARYMQAEYEAPQRRNAYMNYGSSLSATYLFGDGFSFVTDADVVAYSGRSDGFNQGYLIWNAALARDLFKNRRGELRLSGYDLLNKARNIMRTVGESFIEDVATTSLRRFVLLSFTYKFNRMGAAKKGSADATKMEK